MPRYKQEATSEEQEELLMLLQEAQSRGLSLPSTMLKKEIIWPTDSNDYFVKLDGKQFQDREELHRFVNSNARFVALVSGRGGGKALAVDTPILTINGWKLMKDIAPMDYVFDPNGYPTRVIFVSPIMLGHKCYDVIFSDGSVITADEEHLWTTWTHKARKAYKRAKNPRIHPSTITTKEIKETLIHWKKRGDINHSIPVCKPLSFPDKELPIDPYVFGFWLGDGNSRDSRLAIGEDTIIPILESKGLKLSKCKDKYMYQPVEVKVKKDIKTGRFRENKDSLFNKLKTLGVIRNKHIPEIYLFSSFQQRVELLRGLMDSDGCILDNGKMEISFKNEKLANDVHFLLLSFGIKVSINKNESRLYEKSCGFRYRMSFRTSLRIFNLSRKLEKIKYKYRSETENRYIVAVKEVASTPVKCIEVASDSHLYLAGQTLIATHNTAAGAQKALKKIREGESGAVINPDFENWKLATWPEFREWIPWDLVIPIHRYRRNPEWEAHQPFTLVFQNGVKVICKGLKDPDSARGPNINWLWYDEAGRDKDGLAWQVAVAAVRIGKFPQAWITSTPKGKNHWQYNFFEKQDIPQDAIDLFKIEGEGRELIESFSTSIYENKPNLDPGFMASMLATYPIGWLRDQEIWGKYVDQHGSLGNKSWFNGKILPEPWETVEKRVRFWDLAATEKKTTGKKSNDPDETVGTKVACRPLNQNPKLKEFCIEHQIGGQWEWEKIKETVLQTTERDGPFVEIWFEQEPASGGINQVAELKSLIKNNLGSAYRSEGYRPEGDRVMAANIWFAEASQGQWWMVQGNWNESMLDQLSGFPDNTDHDDRITSVSGARLKVAPIRTWRSIPFMKV